MNTYRVVRAVEFSIKSNTLRVAEQLAEAYLSDAPAPAWACATDTLVDHWQLCANEVREPGTYHRTLGDVLCLAAAYTLGLTDWQVGRLLAGTDPHTVIVI